MHKENTSSTFAIMKKCFLPLLSFLFALTSHSQAIQVSDDNFTPQELIEDVLFPNNTDCIQNVSVNNAASGDFPDTSSFGYFQNSGSGFVLDEGIVLSTGRLDNVPGPNSDLSDDDAPNWSGDADLENVLGISNTINATSITFQFTPQADQLSFRYLFASEEYRENESTTCDFSDVFGFLIRPINGNFQNIALVPGTDTPVSVTTVRPDIPNGCDALNEQYFGQFNNSAAPINFNGQTTVLTASTDVIVGTTYEIKLVIADDLNHRFDSAVFIEADSFNLGVDLGQDLIGDRAVCSNESNTLAVQDDLTNVKWFFNDNLIAQDVNQLIIDATDFGDGTYSVQATLSSGCIAEDEIEVEFDQTGIDTDISLQQCDDNDDGLANFNLFNIEQLVGQIDQNLIIGDFYLSESDALQEVDPIVDPQDFSSTMIDQEIFITLVNENGCRSVKNVELIVTSNIYQEVNVAVCSDSDTSPISFGLSDTMDKVAAQIGTETTDLSLHPSKAEAAFNFNEMASDPIEIPEVDLPKTLYIRVQATFDCSGLVPVKFLRLDPPQLNPPEEELLLCVDQQESITLDPGTVNINSGTSFLWENGATTSTLTVDQPGIYSLTVDQTSEIGNETSTCSASATFNVIASEQAEVSTEISGSTENAQVSISAEGLGDYEYALNSTNDFQDENIFQLTEPRNTIYVRDKNGCGIVSKEVNVVQFNEFFTPNADGYNDIWIPVKDGVAKQQIKRIDIFDRYGKLIKILKDDDLSWNGRMNGKPLPSNDYWYRAIFVNGESITGNVTLKR